MWCVKKKRPLREIVRGNLRGKNDCISLNFIRVWKHRSDQKRHALFQTLFHAGFQALVSGSDVHYNYTTVFFMRPGRPDMRHALWGRGGRGTWARGGRVALRPGRGEGGVFGTVWRVVGPRAAGCCRPPTATVGPWAHGPHPHGAPWRPWAPCAPCTGAPGTPWVHGIP